MTERRPAGVNFETWIDRQIRDAAERGEFDNLPGAGKPLPGAGRQDDENWWLNSYLRREGVTGETLLPPAVLLRREAEELPSVVRRFSSEAEVREAVADLNKRIVEHLRQPSDLRISVRPVNVERVVEEWRSARPVAESAPPADPAPEPSSRRRWWHRRHDRRRAG
jgi:hypothetical protein